MRFGVPEPVLDIPKEDRPERTWGNDVLMQVRDLGSFVRILVPVQLTGGYTVTFGAWLSVHPDALRGAWEVWWKPGYSQLELAGILANMIPPWEGETYKKPLEARVIDPDAVPYASGSQDAFMQRVITEEWPHELVLAAIAPYER